MNEDENQELILNISKFYMLFQREILDLMPDNNNSELSALLFKALHEIYLDEHITPSILSKRLAISIPNTSRSLHRLYEMGYIVKIKDEVDKRITHIELSSKGLELVQSSRNLMDKGLISKIGMLNSYELVEFSEAFFILKDLFEKIRRLNSTF